jgi:predicted MFS family arabinose efflux permease
MGVFTAGLFLAVPIGLPVANLCGQLGEWRAIFGVQAACALAGLACAWRSVPKDRGNGSWVAPWNMLGRGPVLAALAAVSLHVGSFFTTVQMASRWLDETGMVRKEAQGWLWVAFGACAAFGSFALGRTSDRIGKRNFVLLASVVLVVCFVLLAGTTTSGRLLPLGLVLAVTAAARTGPLQALTSGLVPSYELGTLMGLRAFAMQAGVGVFALTAAGLQLDHGFAAVLYAAAGCQLLSYLAIRFGVREVRA